MKVKPPVDKVVFTTGTPPGSLSSWGIFTLLHHLLVQQAAYLVRRKLHWFSNYAILGDDLVIGHPKVARQYIRLLKVMGVGISQEKSLRSVNGSLEFASRFVYRHQDLSPVSFKLLAAARSSSSQLWSFFRRVREFRPIRWSEFARLSGAGYRVLGRIGVSYSTANTLPKKWFRLWLLVHHPRAPGGLPRLWWLSCGRGGLIPPEAVGVLHFQLWSSWSSSLEGDGWTLSPEIDKTPYPYQEEVLKAPWLSMYLRSLSVTLNRVVQGELIDPFLDWVPTKRTFTRSSLLDEAKIIHKMPPFLLLPFSAFGSSKEIEFPSTDLAYKKNPLYVKLPCALDSAGFPCLSDEGLSNKVLSAKVDELN